VSRSTTGARDVAAGRSWTLPPPGHRVRAIVVVPARNEMELIERCLDRLRSQEDVESASYEIIVVLDGCTDGTAALVRRSGASGQDPAVHSIEIDRGVGVGRARRIGMDAAFDRLRRLGHRDGLIATTDADTVVASDWLSRQLRLVAEGARAIGGNIELDPLEAQALGPAVLRARSERAARRLAAVRGRGGWALLEHHHFSGASLALTAEAYDA